MSFVDKINKRSNYNEENGSGVIIFTANNTDEERITYAIVPNPKKYSIFKKMLDNNQGGIDISDYGEIVSSWQGNEPDPITKISLKNLFKIEF